MKNDPDERLDQLLSKYHYDLLKDAGLRPPPPAQIPVTAGVTLLALEEMLGIDGGGMMLGEALETWLATPKEQRTPVDFGQLMEEHEKMKAEIDAMVEADFGNAS